MEHSKPRIFISMHYMELGGAERALLGLLGALDPARADVDLFLYRHTGEFMPLIPSHVNLLPERRGYNAIEAPMAQALRQGQWRMVLARLKARRCNRRYLATLPPEERDTDISVFPTIMRHAMPVLPSLADLGEYDLAISFLQPHNVVAEKVRARRRMGWIHTDYSTVHLDVEQELPVWDAMDYIGSISPECTRGFLGKFPSLERKIVEIENIVSPALVRQQAREGGAPEVEQGHGTRIVSVGRVCHAKRYDEIPAIAQQLKERGLDFTWTIVGPGDHSAIDAELARRGVAQCVRFVGAKSNPYPYIAAADIYCQPSRYEGKSVTVREAQMLCRPVLITAYPTAASQVHDGDDGMICPLSNEGIAGALLELAGNKQLRDKLTSNLEARDYGNEREAEKIYQIIG